MEKVYEVVTDLETIVLCMYSESHQNQMGLLNVLNATQRMISCLNFCLLISTVKTPPKYNRFLKKFD